MQEIGAHVDQADPVSEGADRKADVVQFFLGDPQSWKAPVLPPVDVSGLSFFVHAPYVMNVASSNNKIRIPSRKILENHAAAAAKLGARGLIVHGGHVTAGEDPAMGVANWVKALERVELPLPLLVENTAGGEFAMARRMDAIARLWDAIGGHDQVGFCLDTCHFHAAGEELPTIVEKVLAITGRIDLVHANGSRDEFGSGADRHSNFEQGHIDPADIVAVVKAAGAPVVVETPNADNGQKADLDYLRAHLN